MTTICNDELRKFSDWACANRLSINTDKTFYNLISNFEITADFQPAIFLNNRQIIRQSKILFLGVIIDEKLRFNSHVQKVCSKVSKSIGILNRVKCDLPLSTLKTLYYSFIYPFIHYCILIWGCAFNIHLKPLITLQKKAIRIINNVEILAHTNELFYRNHILKIEWSPILGKSGPNLRAFSWVRIIRFF